MESSAIEQNNPNKSRKRVFSEISSSSGEPEVIEIAPPLVDRISNTKAKGKQKEVAYHEIIDVDVDEDWDDVVLLEGNVESKEKQKVASNKKGKEILVDPGHSPNGFNPGSNNFFDLEDYVFDDEYGALQSHFDDIDFPAGIEAPFPWLPVSVPMIKDNPAIPSVSQPNMVDPMLASAMSSSNKRSKAVHGQSNYLDTNQSPVDSRFIQIGNGNYLSKNSNTQVGNVPSSFPQLALNTGHSSRMDTLIPKHRKSFKHKPLTKNKAYPQRAMKTLDRLIKTGGIYSMNDMDQDGSVNGPSLINPSSAESSSSLANLVDGDVKKRYETFKKFDTVVDHSDHHYAKQSSALKQPPKNWAKKIQEEWKILEKDLPDTIYVRVYESRMDLLRAVIIGAEGTPYHDGLFFFDVCFPSSYPNTPPLVYYHSGGLRINPNLYNSGKVCLSLLNTWTGVHNEKWLPGTSTMLQVLVSIQGLILNMKPYFNEPGFAHSSGTVGGEQASLDYNEKTLVLSLKTMVYTMNRPPKNFEDLVIGHFQHRVRDILNACKAYTEGVQVGCLVKGGVQDVDEGNNTCSARFKHDVASYIKPLVAAFEKIGAKEAQEFLSLISVKESPLSAAPGPAYFSPIAGPPLYTPTPPSYKLSAPAYSTSHTPPAPVPAVFGAIAGSLSYTPTSSSYMPTDPAYTPGYPPIHYNSIPAAYNQQW